MIRATILLIIIIGAMASSCRTQEQNEQEAQQLVQQRLQEVDLTQPDKYPLFKDCGELENATNCFYEKLQQQVALKLQDHNLKFEITHRDSVMAVLLIDNKGVISYLGLQTAAVNDKEQLIDSLLHNRLVQMARVEPAYKEDVPVHTSYLLPIVIKPAIK